MKEIKLEGCCGTAQTLGNKLHLVQAALSVKGNLLLRIDETFFMPLSQTTPAYLLTVA